MLTLSNKLYKKLSTYKKVFPQRLSFFKAHDDWFLFLFLYFLVFFFFYKKSIWHIDINDHFGIEKVLKYPSAISSEKKSEDEVNHSNLISNVYDGLMNNYERNKVLLCSSSSDGTVKIWDLSSTEFINTCNIPNYYSWSNSAPLPKRENSEYSETSPFFSKNGNAYIPNKSFLLADDERNYFLSENFYGDRPEEFSLLFFFFFFCI
jgi:WD40 repeat protein